MTPFLKHLIFQSSHRGTKENDLILGAYAKNCLNSLKESEQKMFSQLLQEKDSDIFKWVTNQVPPLKPYEDIIIKIQQFHRLLPA